MSNDQHTFVVVGGGLAGAKAAEHLRAQGFTGRLLLIGAEDELPYERPGLSKGYLAGKSSRESLLVHPRDWYDEHQVELRTGVAVEGIDPAARQVSLADGTSVGYDKLLLATGAEPRKLPVLGAELPGVRYLRTIADSDRIRADLAEVGRVVVIGAGWIGLETAAAVRNAGREVTVLEQAELPLLNVLGREVAERFAELHRRNGVDLRLGVGVAEITGGEGGVDGVRLADGTQLPADRVIIGVGAAPRDELARAAGLDVADGVLVDEHLRTSDPNVFAVGDVARATHPHYGEAIRVEHWANALNQPRVAASSMLGRDAVYDRIPYFYTDQFDLGMEYSGYVRPGQYDAVVFRGDADSGEYIVFWVDAQHRVLAGMNVNVWDVAGGIQDLIRSGRPVDRERLADPTVALDSL